MLSLSVFIPPDYIAKDIKSHAHLQLLSVSFSFILSSDISTIYTAVVTALVLESLIRPTGILARKCCSERYFCDFLLSVLQPTPGQNSQ